ncbi:hypothetical protein HK104_010988 [Borealophlyctis nickersoniae]|nr:hypothetical protein HK104_010988 [Borealophlyctis nickersoniae]
MSEPYLIPYSSVVIDLASEPLGKGGFGIVRKGTWCGSPVALKILKEQTLTKKERDDFTHEARTNQAIPRHTNILAFFGIINEPGHYALVMELMPKGDLIDSGESLDWNERRRIARDIAYGTAKVADFGLSHIRQASMSKAYHLTSGGTVLWKAPELFTFYPKYTKECDVFSYGITLTELFTMAGPYGINYNTVQLETLVELVLANALCCLPSTTSQTISRIAHLDSSASAPVYRSARDGLTFTPPSRPPREQIGRLSPAAQFPTLTTTPPKSASTSSSELAASIVNPADLKKLYEMGRALDPEYGDEESRNHSAAFEWYHKAAIAGHPASQSAVGFKSEKGLGVGQNAAKAVEWYQKAADRGDTRAQFNLGCCCWNGVGVGKDMKIAVHWFEKAAKQGHASAQVNLGYCYQNGLVVGKDERKAVEWFRKAADQGDPSGEFNLGCCYCNGVGVGKDMKIAVHWFEKAAKQAHASAQNNLGLCYEHGFGVGKDERKAVECYKMAAEQGNAVGQFKLGSCYEKGTGVAKDETRAVVWHRKAAAQGQANAIRALADLGVCV